MNYTIKHMTQKLMNTISNSNDNTRIVCDLVSLMTTYIELDRTIDNAFDGETFQISLLEYSSIRDAMLAIDEDITDNTGLTMNFSGQTLEWVVSEESIVIPSGNTGIYSLYCLSGSTQNEIMTIYHTYGDYYYLRIVSCIPVSSAVSEAGFITVSDILPIAISNININDIMITAMDVARSFGAEVTASSSTASSAMQQFATVIGSNISSLSGDAGTIYSSLLQTVGQGLQPTLNMIKSYLQPLESAHELADHTIGFTDNSAFRMETFLFGAIKELFGAVSTFVSGILTYAAGAIGLVVYAISQAATTLWNAISNRFDDATLAHFNMLPDEAFEYEFPYGAYQISLRDQDARNLKEVLRDLGYDIDFYGSIIINLPGCNARIWTSTIEENNAIVELVNMEMKFDVFAPDIYADKPMGFTYADSQPGVYKLRNYTIPYVSEAKRIEAIQDFYDKYSTNSALRKDYLLNTDLTKTQLDAELFNGVCNAMTWFILFMMVSLTDSTGPYNTVDDASNSYVSYFRIILEACLHDADYAEHYLSWEDIATSNPSALYRIQNLADNQTWAANFPTFSMPKQVECMLSGFQAIQSAMQSDDESLITPFDGHINQFIYVPKYDRAKTLAIVISSAALTAIAAAGITIAAIKIKTRMNRNYTMNKAAAEKAWANLGEDPSPENLKAYRKAVKKTNLLATFTGKSKISKVDYWNAPSDNAVIQDETTLSTYYLIKGFPNT